MNMQDDKNKLDLYNSENKIDIFKHIAVMIEEARKSVARSVNSEMCTTYYEIGRMIVEEEMKGSDRAQYGKKVINSLSHYLTEKFGKGFSVTNLKNCRKFYKVYSSEIGQKPSDQFKLSWSQTSSGGCIVANNNGKIPSNELSEFLRIIPYSFYSIEESAKAEKF